LASPTLSNPTYTGTLTGSTGILNIGSGQVYKDASGNVGIGTSSPINKLSVSANSSNILVIGSSIGGGNTPGFDFITNPNTPSTWRAAQIYAYDTGVSYGGGLIFTTNSGSSTSFGTVRMLIDSSGNVGIGTTIPSTKLDVYGVSAGVSPTWQGGTDFIKLQAGGAGTSYSEQAISFQESGNNIGAKIGVKNKGNGAYDIIFANRDNSSPTSTLTEKMRIDASGSVGIGTTSAVSVGAGVSVLSLKASGTAWGVGPTASFASFYIKSASSTGVVLTTSATSWASDSDERKKTTLIPFANAAEKVCSLRAGTGRYLTDEENMSRSFLIAQDVQAVLPEAVDVGEDEDQSLMLRYTDLIPLLTAAIQEQQTLIEELTARLTKAGI
jgi:hypothetical protein